MRDVEDQLRAYGDAVEGAITGAPSVRAGRVGGVFRGALVGAVVLGLVDVGTIAVRDDGSGGEHASTATPRRVVGSTSPHVCSMATGCVPYRPQRTRVWLLADTPGVQRASPVALRILGPSRPPFCRGADVVPSTPRLVYSDAAAGGRYR